MLDLGAELYWTASWAWGVPVVVLTMLMHGAGLSLIRAGVAWRMSHLHWRGVTSPVRSAVLFGTVVILATTLHAIEAVIWGWVYVTVGALGNPREAMLYSLSAMTSFGHAGVFLNPRWQMLGAIEALNGMILFGLTTAFLFHIMQKVWSGPRQ
jgi:hypothetical protein